MCAPMGIMVCGFTETFSTWLVSTVILQFTSMVVDMSLKGRSLKETHFAILARIWLQVFLKVGVLLGYDNRADDLWGLE